MENRSLSRRINKIRHLPQHIWLATQSRAIILLYHRVAKLSSDPQLLTVSPEHFAEHMEHIRKHYYPISLLQLRDALSKGYVPHRAVVVTFDDGYADNLWNAKPILEHYEIPATVFITTDYSEKAHQFWWDKVETLLLLNPQLPEYINLVCNGRTYQWKAGGCTKASQNGKQWNVELQDNPTPCHKAYREICELFCPLGEVEREMLIRQLESQIANEDLPKNLQRVLSIEEIRQLAAGQMIEIGAHTVTHPVLGKLPTKIQQKEIARCRQYLEAITKRPITSFSYPYGRYEDVNEDTINLVRETGYKTACANFRRPVTRNSNMFFLPRCVVRNWNRNDFAKKLRGYFHSFWRYNADPSDKHI